MILLEKLNIIPIKFILIVFVGLHCMDCAPAPRYKSGSSSISTTQSNEKRKSNKTVSVKQKNKKNTFNKSKMVYKGISSYYGPKFHGKLTANGEIFDMYGVTAAHKEFPFNTVTRVTNENNGKSLIIRINDRGPYVGDRILDCSFGAAKKLGFVSEGTAPVKIEIIEWGDGEYMHHD
tara:strand:+ start:13 stop:543 length:531 start_codon:yes stop_codon:yes gene_type:complete